MTKEIALLLCCGFVFLLFMREEERRPLLDSRELWIPFVWILIIGSRPVSAWVVKEVDPEQVAASYLEGTPLDRNIFLFLIVAALFILWRHRGDWGRVLAENRWLVVFFLYCGISIMWSDFPFVSAKRWVKDLGNLLMVLIILSQPAPFAAVRALFARYICVAVPVSIFLIKYYPDLGRYYTHWSYEPAYCGVATNKNELGIILVICGLFLLLDLLETREIPVEERGRLEVAVPLLLLMMTTWLLRIAGSATAQVCLLMGGALLAAMRLQRFKEQSRYLTAVAVGVVALIVFLYSIPSVPKGVLTMLGRDATFTGRTEIWKDVLSEGTNPWIGTGYRSFWLGPAMERLQLNQAHNGYLETYLNGGFLGLSLLLAVLTAAVRRFADTLEFADEFGALRFSFFAVAVVYNWTEAMFNGLSLIWFVLLLAVVEWPEPEGEYEYLAASAPGASGLTEGRPLQDE